MNECYNTAKITQRDNETNAEIGYVGGISGFLGYDVEGKISNSYNAGEIITNGKWISGISGVARGSEINNCYNAGNITVTNAVYHKHIGGIASSTYYDSTCGEKICKITNSYNLAEIKLIGNTMESDDFTKRRNIGGIIGEITNGYTNIENNYNKGNITATVSGAYIGGICARIWYEGTQIAIKDCSTSTPSHIGINQNSSTNVAITNVNVNVANMPNVLDVINKNNNAFVEDSKNINRGYPVLRWQIENYKK